MTPSGLQASGLLLVIYYWLLQVISTQENGYSPWKCLDISPYLYQPDDAPFQTLDCGPRLISMDRLPVVSAILNVTAGRYVIHSRRGVDLRLNKIHAYTKLSKTLLDLKLSKNKSSDMAKDDYALQTMVFEDFLQNVDAAFDNLKEIRALAYKMKASVHKRLDLAKFFRYEMRIETEDRLNDILGKVNHTDMHDAVRQTFSLIRELHTDKIYCLALNRSRDPRATANESPCLSPDHLVPKMKAMRSSMRFQFELVKLLVEFEAKEAAKTHERAHTWARQRRKQYGRVRNLRRKLKRKGGTISRLRNMHAISKFVLHNVTTSNKITRRCGRSLRQVQTILDNHQKLKEDLKMLYDNRTDMSNSMLRCPVNNVSQEFQTIPSLMRDAKTGSLKLQDRKSDLDDVISYYSKMAASITEHTRLFSSDIQLRMRRLTNAMTFTDRYTFVLDGLRNVTDDVTQASRDTRNATRTLKELRRLLNSVVVYIPPPTTATTTVATTTPSPTTTPSTTLPTTTLLTKSTSSQPDGITEKQIETTTSAQDETTTKRLEVFTTAPIVTEFYTNIWGRRFSRIVTQPTKPRKTTTPVSTTPLTATETTSSTKMTTMSTTPTTTQTAMTTTPSTTTQTTTSAREDETTTKRLEAFTTAPIVTEFYTDFWGNRFSRIVTQPTKPRKTTSPVRTTSESTTPLTTTETSTASTTPTTASTTTETTTTTTIPSTSTQSSTTTSATEDDTTTKRLEAFTTAPFATEFYTDFWGNRFSRIVTQPTKPISTTTATAKTTTEEDVDYSGSGDISEMVTLPEILETSPPSTSQPTTSSTSEPSTTIPSTTEATTPYTGEYEVYTNYWGNKFTRRLTRPTTMSTTPTTTEAGFWNGRRRKRDTRQDKKASLQFTTDFWKRYHKKLTELDAELSSTDANSSEAKVRDKRAWWWDDDAEGETTTVPEATTPKTTLKTTFSTQPRTKVTPLWPASTQSKWPTSQKISSVDDSGDIIPTSTLQTYAIVSGDDDPDDVIDMDEGSGEVEPVTKATLAPPGDRNATIMQTVFQLRQDLQKYRQSSQAEILKALRLRSSSEEITNLFVDAKMELNVTELYLGKLASSFAKADLGNLTSLEPRLTSLDGRHDDVMKRMESLRDSAAQILEKVNHTRWRLREIRQMIHVATPGGEVARLKTAHDQHNFKERRVWAKHRQVEALANSLQSNLSSLRETIGKAMKNVNFVQPVYSVKPGTFAQTRLPYDIILPSLRSSIHVHVRTLSPDGTFFSITDPRLRPGQVRENRRIRLSVMDGRPLAEWLDSSFVTNMTTRRPINDGNWHTIKLEKIGRSWTMSEFTAPHQQAAITASTTLPFWSMLDYSPHMFIWSSRQRPPPPKNDSRHVEFGACLTNVVINGKVLRPETSVFNHSSENECHSTSQYLNVFRLSREMSPHTVNNQCLAKRPQTLMLPYDVTNDTLAFSFRPHDSQSGTLLLYHASSTDLFVVGVASGHVIWEGRIRGHSFRRICYEMFPGESIWHHVVIMFEATSTTFYVDNRICATINMAVMTTSTRSPMMIVYTAYRGRLVASLPSRQPLMRFHGDIKHVLYNNRLFPVYQSAPCGRRLQNYG